MEENIFHKAFREYTTDYIECADISEELENNPELAEKVSEIVANELMNDDYLWGEIESAITETIESDPDIIKLLSK